VACGNQEMISSHFESKLGTDHFADRVTETRINKSLTGCVEWRDFGGDAELRRFAGLGGLDGAWRCRVSDLVVALEQLTFPRISE